MGLQPRYALLLLLANTSAFTGVGLAQFADDGIYYLDSGHEIEADEEQQEKLSDTESKYSDLLQPLKKQHRRLKREIRDLELKRSAELHSILTPRQLASINTQRLAETRERVSADITFLAEFADFASGLAGADNAKLFEGFARKKPGEAPDPSSDALKIKGFDFYPQPLRNLGAKLELLRQTVTNHQLLSPTAPGGKFCGGFHPDLALRYGVDGVQHHVLICLTCAEMWVVREGVDHVEKIDFSSEARSTLKRIAESCFVNRKQTVPK